MTHRLWLLGLLASAAGCSSAPATGTVAGLVTLDGKPVAGGAVSLLSTAGGTPSMADIGPDGRFRAENVPTGEVMVAVISPPPEVDEAVMKAQPGAKGPPPPAKPKVQYPPRYADHATSGLKTAVKASGEVLFDIPMRK